VDDVAYLSALVLAATFVWAAVTKLTDRARTAAGFAALGVPRAATAARVVPAIELVLAAALALAPAPAAVLAGALLVAFTIVLARAIAQGVRVGCGCFGSSRREHVSPADLVRNALLLAAAVVATGASGPTWPALAAVGLVAVATIVVVVVLALVELRTATGRLLGPATPVADAVAAGLPDARPVANARSTRPARRPADRRAGPPRTAP
jgi:hypothetical protein